MIFIISYHYYTMSIIENHQKEGDALKDIADVFEDVHYNELYK